MADVNRREIIKLFGGAAAAIPAVKEVSTLTVESCDAVVLTFDDQISSDNRRRISDIWRELETQMGKRIPLIILDGGCQMSVLKGGRKV